MIKQGHRLHALNEPYRRHRISFYLIEYDDAGNACDVKVTREDAPIDMRRLDPRPTFQLAPEDAQALMDDLWHAGLRPTEGRQSEGVTEAQANHLADMRQIAFAKLNVEKP